MPDPFGDGGRARGSTAPAIWCAAGRTASWSSSAASTSRSRCAASASSSGEIEAALLRTRRCAQAVVAAARGPRRATRGWSPTSCRRAGATAPTRPSCASSPARRACPSTWCPPRSWSLDALPLTPNGKVDRAGAAGAGRSAPRRRAASCAPRTPVEELLAGIWARGARRRSGSACDDDFFDARRPLAAGDPGGRRGSRAAFGVELPLRALFEAPTVAGLAGAIEAAARAAGGRSQAPPLRAGRRADGGACRSPSPRSGSGSSTSSEPGRGAYNIPAALPPERAARRAGAAQRRSDEIVRRHEALRTTFADGDGDGAGAGGAEPAGAARPAAGRPRRAPGGRTRDEVAAPAPRTRPRRPFDLARGPLLRAALLRLGDGATTCCCSRSTTSSATAGRWACCVRELAALYAALDRGARRAPLPRAADPVRRLRGLAARAGSQGEVARAPARLLARAAGRRAALLELPTDRPRPAVADAARRRHAASRCRRTCRARCGLRPRASGATLFMVAARRLRRRCSHRYTGRTTSSVGTPIANRSRGEIERPDRLLRQHAGAAHATSPATRVRRAAGRASARRRSAAYAHQDLPFEQLVEELQPGARPGAHAPLFQVHVRAARTRRAAAARTARRSTVEPLGRRRAGTAKFDLSCALGESGRRARAACCEYSRRPVRRGDRRAAGAATSRALLRGAVGRPGAAVWRAAAARRAASASQLLPTGTTPRRDCVPEPAPACTSCSRRRRARTPDALGRRSRRRRRLSYGELDARAEPAGAPPARAAASGRRCRVGVCARALARAGGGAARRS